MKRSISSLDDSKQIRQLRVRSRLELACNSDMHCVRSGALEFLLSLIEARCSTHNYGQALDALPSEGAAARARRGTSRTLPPCLALAASHRNEFIENRPAYRGISDTMSARRE